MPKIRHSETIKVNAAIEVAFDLVAGDVMAVDDEPDKMTGHRPLTDGPLRQGFQWQQRIVHNRKLCHTWWNVSDVVRPRVLEQTMTHYCADAENKIHGGERWEFHVDDGGSTRVELSSWRSSRGLAGWISKILQERAGSDDKLSIKRRLAYVQFEAERRSQVGA